MLREETSNYTYGWQAYNSTFKPQYSFERVYNAFQYRTASILNGYPIIGTYNNYWGGGYVYEMRGQKSYLQGNLTLLQKLNWIDRQTRAVIIEFSVFNPNINLIAVAEIIVEILPTGTIVKSARFDPINIFTSLSLFTLTCCIIYIVFIIYYTIQEIREFYKQGKSYIFQFWSFVEWAIIIFSWTAFALFIYKIEAASEVSKFFKRTSGYGYFKMQSIAFCNLVLNYSLAFCIAFSTLKFLKIFGFNSRISYLGLTLGTCAKELIGFCLMFIIIWMSFVQLFHLFFEKILYHFSTLTRSMATCFDIMLGKFQVDSLLRTDPLFGPIFYFIYNVFIVFILLTMFISIINDSFIRVRENTRNQGNESKLLTYLSDRFKHIFRKKVKT